METHLKQQNLATSMNELFPGWRFESNHSEEADNGRIILVWDPVISVIIYLKTPQFILCGVFNPISNQSFTMAFIYAWNTREERIPLWDKLKELVASSPVNQSPWLVISDFNQILSLYEAYSLLPATISLLGMRNF